MYLIDITVESFEFMVSRVCFLLTSPQIWKRPINSPILAHQNLNDFTVCFIWWSYLAGVGDVTHRPPDSVCSVCWPLEWVSVSPWPCSGSVVGSLPAGTSKSSCGPQKAGREETLKVVPPCFSQQISLFINNTFTSIAYVHQYCEELVQCQSINERKNQTGEKNLVRSWLSSGSGTPSCRLLKSDWWPSRRTGYPVLFPWCDPGPARPPQRTLSSYRGGPLTSGGGVRTEGWGFPRLDSDRECC